MFLRSWKVLNSIPIPPVVACAWFSSNIIGICFGVLQEINNNDNLTHIVAPNIQTTYTNNYELTSKTKIFGKSSLSSSETFPVRLNILSPLRYARRSSNLVRIFFRALQVIKKIWTDENVPEHEKREKNVQIGYYTLWRIVSQLSLEILTNFIDIK